MAHAGGQILPFETILRLRQDWKRTGRTLVFTNGCFDLLHVGHIRYLREARDLGDILVVGMNSDTSTRALKGPERPIMPQDDRAEMLTALRWVDYVVIFDDLTAEPLVAALQPDIYVKGGDYGVGGDAAGAKPLPEAAIVTGYGGVVKVLPLVAGRSSTDIVQRVLSRYRGERRFDNT